MTELQREYVLAERADKRNAEMLRQKLLKKVAWVVLCGCVPQAASGERCWAAWAATGHARDRRFICVQHAECSQP